MAMYRVNRAGCMGNKVTFVIRGAVGSMLIALPVLAQAAALSVSPVLLDDGSVISGSTVPVAAPPSPQAVTSSAAAVAPLSLNGYAQWKSPAKTLESVGYGMAASGSSYGTNLPLKDALRLILPQGWHVYAKSGVSGSVPVTWKAKSTPWTDPLRNVLRQSGLEATVNWPHQAVLLRVQPVHKAAPLSTKGYTAWNHSSSDDSGAPLPENFHVGHAGHGAEDFSVPTVPSLANATPVFLLNQGDLILTDLQKWAKQSGWTVVWQVPEDWQVPNTTTFSGDFQKAVSQVIQALSANGANVHAVFHTANNTVVISGAGGGE